MALLSTCAIDPHKVILVKVAFIFGVSLKINSTNILIIDFNLDLLRKCSLFCDHVHNIIITEYSHCISPLFRLALDTETKLPFVSVFT